MINKLVIDSTHARTELCNIGAAAGTDKSPFSENTPSGHRHAYTAVYDLLFGQIRNELITVGEIGIERNQSMHMWRAYFSNAFLLGWEYDEQKIERARGAELFRTEYHFMDVRSVDSIVRGFEAGGRLLDVLIEDSSHEFDDQVRVLSVAHRFLNPGAYLVIEDVYKRNSEAAYEEALSSVSKHYSSMFFVEPLHPLQYSGDAQSDKLLVLRRNEDYVGDV